ncbi:unnamed protein product [Symbiodinium natans]|uniref:Uncharacterized protein n=1 Tax=Symbiodinium natans TaxID=878477 RepID=A0A812UI83_9DINO|nr:unnamed protein product [Symbiodinium natans]
MRPNSTTMPRGARLDGYPIFYPRTPPSEFLFDAQESLQEPLVPAAASSSYHHHSVAYEIIGGCKELLKVSSLLMIAHPATERCRLLRTRAGGVAGMAVHAAKLNGSASHDVGAAVC